MRLQMENSLDKSKLLMVPSMLTVSKEIPAAFPPTVYSKRSAICELHLNL